MSAQAVFLDRDHTVIEDPGYLSEPSAVTVLPGVEAALRSLSQAGFRLVVVTNQSGIARGLLTVEALQAIHDQMQRQLAARGAHLDGVYYCPYHPEGTVEPYARDSEDRKPRPGMLLRAARDLDIDLTGSWMVGDSPRDIEAGQRAGCRTIRVRVGQDQTPGQDEDVQADFTVRNLADAARVILRETGRAPGPAEPSPGAVQAAGAGGAPPAAEDGRPVEKMSDSQVLQEILRHVRHLGAQRSAGEFSAVRLAAAIFQAFALVALGIGLVHAPGVTASYANQITMHAAMLTAIVLQLVALTLFILSRQR